MPDPTFTANAMIYAGAIVSSVTGFVACAALFKHTHQRTAIGVLYLWGTIFFAGSGLLAVNWAMGPTAPIPIRPPASEHIPLGMAPLMLVWMLVCLAGIVAQRAFKVANRPMTTSEGIQLRQQKMEYEQRLAKLP